MNIENIEDLTRAMNHWAGLAEQTNSRHLQSVYRRKAQEYELRIGIAENKLKQLEKAHAEKRSDNAMRMEMDPPSADLVPVKGPSVDPAQARENARRVTLQAIAAENRDDGMLASALRDRAARLKEIAA